MAFLRDEPIAMGMEIPLLFFFFAAEAGQNRHCTGRCGVSLSRSEQNCRRLSRNQVLEALELTLGSNWRQDESFLLGRARPIEAERTR